MNKLLAFLLLLALALGLGGCAAPALPATQVATQPRAPVTATAPAQPPSPIAPTQLPSPTLPPATIEEIIADEMRASFDYFWEQTNSDPESPGYGLVRDRWPGSEDIASTAAVGFGLTAYVIGVEKGYISTEQGYERVDKTLDTLLAMDQVEGFFYHFVDMQTGKRAWESEVSSIDTAILMMGVLTAGEYFGGQAAEKAQQLYDRVNWPWFIDEGREMYAMAYRPEKGFEGAWDFYAEQLMLYILGAGSETYPTGEGPYYSFNRHRASYGQGEAFIHSWFGSIFTYQFSHAWIDFRDTTDKLGVNWFINSTQAVQAQVEFAEAMDEKYETIGPLAWGLSSSDGPDGYNGLYGAPPSGFTNDAHFIDDTVPPYGAIGSILFAPDPAKRAMQNYYSIEGLKGPYGFKDAYNLSEGWFASDVIGIDKGISLLMLANYENNLVYSVTMKNPVILNGLAQLQITKSQ